jgi:hypothetical protein
MRYLKVLITLGFLLLQGCAGMDFKDAGEPPLTPQYALHDWPYEEIWTGILFNGNKIGFSRLHMALDEKRPGTFLITSEASLYFRFLNIDKEVKLYSRDWVNPNLTINGFVYDYDLDGNHMKLYGVVRNNVLTVVIDSSSGRITETHPLRAPLYPTSVINLYPVFHGLKLDTQYQFDVYDGESQRMTTLLQTISAYESSDLFSGEAYKVKTSMDGQDVTTWINSIAEPLLEISMNGVFIAGLESESMAKRYLTQAALNKDENLLNFSLIKTDQPLLSPREMSLLELEIIGAESLQAFPNDLRQRCESINDMMRCRISGSHSPVTLDELRRDYLTSSISVPTHHPTIKRIADSVTAESETELDKITALLNWLDNNIKPQATDVFTALDVLKQRKAECQGFSFLYTSLARSLGIPTRVVNGIVYSEQYPGFLYHTWVESQVDGHWQSIDPILNQLHADATHIKLVEGENSADLTPLLGVIGKLSARIVESETDEE